MTPTCARSSTDNRAASAALRSLIARTVKPTGVAVYTVNVARTGGFTGAVELALTGQPAGVTYVFTPNPVEATTTLNVITSAFTPLGTFPLTITGRSRTTTVNLVVTTGLGLTTAQTSQTAAAGSTATYQLTLARPVGATFDPATLVASGLPAGVTPFFSPNPTVTSSTLTLSVPASIPPGTYQFAVSATGGGLNENLPLTLVVLGVGATTTTAVAGATTTTVAGALVLNALPATLTVPIGSPATYTIDLQQVPGPVTLGLGGLPSGATAVFGANPASGPTTLLVTTTAATPAGTYPLTITAVSGTVVRSTVGSLTVGGSPSFALAATPATLTIARGTAGTTNVLVTPAGGFTGAVAFSVTGGSATLTAAFTAVSSTTGTQLIVAPSAAATPGTTTLTITGSSGGLAATIQVTVLVT